MPITHMPTAGMAYSPAGRQCSINATAAPQRQRLERLIAEMIALSELVMIDESMPTPHTTRF